MGPTRDKVKGKPKKKLALGNYGNDGRKNLSDGVWNDRPWLILGTGKYHNTELSTIILLIFL